jgi:hypothetical protein
MLPLLPARQVTATIARKIDAEMMVAAAPVRLVMLAKTEAPSTHDSDGGGICRNTESGCRRGNATHAGGEVRSLHLSPACGEVAGIV